MTLLPPRLRRALLGISAIIAFLILAGATYQGVANALERRRYRYPGQLVDVGGHQLHIYCTGQGAPTVVLEAPATGMSAAWGWVQPLVSDTTRICSYDRAGLGWSEAGDRPFDPAAVPEQLRALLAGAGERAPYILVGQELGAAFATLYAARFGTGVRALVLVDPPFPDPAASPAPTLTRLVRASPWLARAGLLRATRLLSDSAAGLPEPAGGALTAFLNRPDHLTRAARELSRWNEAVQLAVDAPLDPAVRLVRLNVRGAAPLPFLTERADADAVSAAIIGVLRGPG